MNEHTDTPTESTTECATESVTKQTSSYTQVKTGYARACIVLLAVNFVLTGYCFLQISKYQGEQIDVIGETANTPTVGATAAGQAETTTQGENQATSTKGD